MAAETAKDRPAVIIGSVSQLALQPETNLDALPPRFAQWFEQRGWAPHPHQLKKPRERRSASTAFTRRFLSSNLGSAAKTSENIGSPMQAAPAFLKFTAQFHQDIFDIHESPDEGVVTAFESLSKQEQGSLRTFLARCVASRTSDNELSELWNSAQSDYYLSGPGQVRDFFRWILRRIAS